MNKVIDDLKNRMQVITDKKSLNSDDLKFLEDCLYNKWYGVQVMASKVLAKHHPQKPPTSSKIGFFFILIIIK